MLKITPVNRRTQLRLIVEGRLIAPWAAELRSACEEARADLCGRELVVELKHVSTISQEGENLIVELLNQGVKLQCHGVFTKLVLKQLIRRADGNCREMKK